VTCNLNIKTMTHTESTLSLKSEALIAKEDQYSAHNYHPFASSFRRGEVFMFGMLMKKIL
jgi:hypothetical protein